MKRKELIKILKSVPKDAEITILKNADFLTTIWQDSDGLIGIDFNIKTLPENEKVLDKAEEN